MKLDMWSETLVANVWKKNVEEKKRGFKSDI